MKKYYEAYDQRYQIIHQKGHSWSSDTPTPIVYDVMQKYNLSSLSILEIGCGEGRDALYLLKKGYGVTASNISAEAINYCKLQNPDYCDNFIILDCINDRNSFCRFIHDY